jgi:hypothetical protein
VRSLARSIRRPDRGGEPLPTVYKTFERNGVLLRRGEVTLIAAPPGAGKSSLGLDIAIKMQRPTLYFSADSTELTQATRIGSYLTGRYMFDVEQQIMNDPEWASSILNAAEHVRWSFDSSPSFTDLDLELEAFEELWGEPPHLTVVDNLTDIITQENGDEFSNLRATMRGLKYSARDKNTSVLVLHHTSEGDYGEVCPSRKSIHGKVSQVPAVVMTLGDAMAYGGHLPIACVKNRQGMQDRTGKTAMWLNFNPAVMHLSDI